MIRNVVCFASICLLTGFTSAEVRTKYCADEKCQTPLFDTVASKPPAKNSGSHPDVLRYKVGEQINIFAIGLSDVVYLWEAQISNPTSQEGLKKVYVDSMRLSDYKRFADDLVANGDTLFLVTLSDGKITNSTLVPAHEALQKMNKFVGRYYPGILSDSRPPIPDPGTLKRVLNHDYHAHTGHDHHHGDSSHDHVHHHGDSSHDHVHHDAHSHGHRHDAHSHDHDEHSLDHGHKAHDPATGSKSSADASSQDIFQEHSSSTEQKTASIENEPQLKTRITPQFAESEFETTTKPASVIHGTEKLKSTAPRPSITTEIPARIRVTEPGITVPTTAKQEQPSLVLSSIPKPDDWDDDEDIEQEIEHVPETTTQYASLVTTVESPMEVERAQKTTDVPPEAFADTTKDPLITAAEPKRNVQQEDVHVVPEVQRPPELATIEKDVNKGKPMNFANADTEKHVVDDKVVPADVPPVAKNTIDLLSSSTAPPESHPTIDLPKPEEPPILNLQPDDDVTLTVLKLNQQMPPVTFVRKMADDAEILETVMADNGQRAEENEFVPSRVEVDADRDISAAKSDLPKQQTAKVETSPKDQLNIRTSVPPVHHNVETTPEAQQTTKFTVPPVQQNVETIPDEAVTQPTAPPTPHHVHTHDHKHHEQHFHNDHKHDNLDHKHVHSSNKHDHDHDARDHDHGHHHHHHHGPTVADRVAETAKTGKTWALWIKDNLKPFVVALKMILTTVHRLVPAEWRDIIGLREILFSVVVACTIMYIMFHWLVDLVGGSNERKSRLMRLCKFAELYEKVRILELQNEKLKAANVDSEKFDAEIRKAKALCDCKSQECDSLADEVAGLKAESDRLRKEIAKLTDDLKKMSDKSAFDRELSALRAANAALELDLKEFKNSFEREKEMKERLEKDYEKASHDSHKFKEDKTKLTDSLKSAEASAAVAKEDNKKLQEKCAHLESQCRELEGLKLALSRKRNVKTTEGKPKNKNSSDGTESNNGKDWDWADDFSGAESDVADVVKQDHDKQQWRASDDLGLLSADQVADLARLGAELKEKLDEIDRLKALVKDLMQEKQTLEKTCESFNAENEKLNSALRDGNERSFTLESKIKALKDVYEDQLKDLTKQLTKYQLEKEKQSSTISTVEEDIVRIREENATLRKIDGELRSEIKKTDNLLERARVDLDRCQHDRWNEARRYEREQRAVQSENALLRARLVSAAPPVVRSDDEKALPISSPEVVRGGHNTTTNAGDVSNNSSEAELAGITSTLFPRGGPRLPAMPSHPPPPLSLSAYGPPPPPLMSRSGYLSGGGSSYYSYDDYGHRPSPVQSPRDYYYGSRHEARGVSRRNKSKARSNPSRSPSPPAGAPPRREASDYTIGGGRNRRARSRGGTLGRDQDREGSVSPPLPPRRNSRREDNADYGPQSRNSASLFNK